MENFFDQGKSFVCGKLPFFVENLFAENFLVCEKFPWSRKHFLWKTSFLVENFLDCRRFSWLWKSSLIKKQFLDHRKVPWLWKTSLIHEISLTVENFLDCEKLPKIFLTVESYLIKENFLECRKFLWSRKNLCLLKNFLTAEKIIGLIILKTNADVEAIKIFFLSLEQKLKSLAFFAVDKIDIILSWTL